MNGNKKKKKKLIMNMKKIELMKGGLTLKKKDLNCLHQKKKKMKKKNKILIKKNKIKKKILKK
jgi:hypothetical protein